MQERAGRTEARPPGGAPGTPSRSGMDVPLARRPRGRRWVVLAAAAAGLSLVTWAVGRLAEAPPRVERSSLWIDGVKRGSFVRQVSGPGTLVPEDIRWITARTEGRVERIALRAGSPVEAETLLAELASPDLELQALEAERQHTAGVARLVDLRATLENERLKLRATLARIRAEQQDASRRADANERLLEHGAVGMLEYRRTRESADELAERLRIEEERLRVLERSSRARVEAQEAEVERLRALADHQADQLASLKVRAGAPGVLQQIPLEVGQRVAAGELLAKVVDPSRLKAELRIPENQAREIQVGQRAHIDTRGSVVDGRVVRIDPAVQRGTVSVDVALDGALPQGARPDLSVDGRIELERLENVLYTGRPAFGVADANVTLFRLAPDGETAERVRVELGGSSVSAIEIRSGLEEGDQVVLSDMSEWDAVERVQID